MSIYEIIMKNAEEFYREGEHTYSAKMLEENGFSSHLRSNARTYYITTVIDKNSDTVIMKIYPGICCREENLTMLSEYVLKVNSIHKCGNLRIDMNGALHAHIETMFDNTNTVSKDIFKKMEDTLMNILVVFGDALEKLACGKLLKPEEIDPKLVIMKHIDISVENDEDENDEDEETERLRRKLFESISEKRRKEEISCAETDEFPGSIRSHGFLNLFHRNHRNMIPNIFDDDEDCTEKSSSEIIEDLICSNSDNDSESSNAEREEWFQELIDSIEEEN